MNVDYLALQVELNPVIQDPEEKSAYRGSWAAKETREIAVYQDKEDLDTLEIQGCPVVLVTQASVDYRDLPVSQDQDMLDRR